MNNASLLALLQFSDGTFPTGAYAHSSGLETYVQDGIVSDAVGVEQFIRTHLQGAIGRADAAAVAISMRTAAANDLRGCADLDLTLDAMKTASEQRAASRQLGHQAMRILNALTDDGFVAQFAGLVERNVTPCHHAAVFGIAGAAFQWRPLDAAVAYLYSSAGAIVGAALRLIPLGQTQGQMILHSLTPLISWLAENAVLGDIGSLSSFAPGLEIAAMRHARLEARLFRS